MKGLYAMLMQKGVSTQKDLNMDRKLIWLVQNVVEDDKRYYHKRNLIFGNPSGEKDEGEARILELRVWWIFNEVNIFLFS